MVALHAQGCQLPLNPEEEEAVCVINIVSEVL